MDERHVCVHRDLGRVRGAGGGGRDTRIARISRFVASESGALSPPVIDAMLLLSRPGHAHDETRAHGE